MGARLTRRAFLGASGAALLSHCQGSRLGDPDQRPNILFLLSDDQRWDTLGCMGNRVLETPNLDQIAAQGALFRNSFVTTSVCPVNRACVLSGQHMRTHGISGFGQSFSPEAFAATYPALLRAAGYRTGFIGKYGIGWHESSLPVGEFDEWWGFPGQGEYFMEHQGRPVHSTAWMADRAIEFMGRQEPHRPWCLSVSFKAPHMPWTEYDPAFRGLYENRVIPVPPTASNEAEATQPPFIRDSLVGSRGFWDDPENDVQAWIRDYYRLVKGIDVAAGRMLDALQSQGMGQNTIVIYTSDNGMLLHEHGLMGKWLMYEESIRVPMLVFDPRLPAQLRRQDRDEMVLGIDCAPTLLDLAGVPVPDSMQGQSLVPLLLERNPPWRADWYYEHSYSPPYPDNIPRSEGVRTDRWKYILYPDQEPGYEQLFDLSEDPLETTNLAGRPDQADTLARLRSRLEYWRETLPVSEPIPDATSRHDVGRPGLVGSRAGSGAITARNHHHNV